MAVIERLRDTDIPKMWKKKLEEGNRLHINRKKKSCEIVAETAFAGAIASIVKLIDSDETILAYSFCDESHKCYGSIQLEHVFWDKLDPWRTNWVESDFMDQDGIRMVPRGEVEKYCRRYAAIKFGAGFNSISEMFRMFETLFTCMDSYLLDQKKMENDSYAVKLDGVFTFMITEDGEKKLEIDQTFKHHVARLIL